MKQVRFESTRDFKEFDMLMEEMGGAEPSVDAQTDDSQGDHVDKVKEVLDKLQKVGGELEDLVKDPSIPAKVREGLMAFDQHLSKMYLKMYQFVNKVKVDSYTTEKPEVAPVVEPEVDTDEEE